MKKLRQIIALALVLGCASALAEWTEIDRFEDGTRIYADRGNTQRNGDISQVLHLVRWGEAQADPGQAPYLSTLVRTAYDCANKHEKYLASTSFAGPMGDGERIVADEDAAPNWASISEGSMEEKLWKIACGVD
jgi:hypothetical protein